MRYFARYNSTKVSAIQDWSRPTSLLKSSMSKSIWIIFMGRNNSIENLTILAEIY